MTVKELIKLLKKVVKNHPEAKTADVWFYRNPTEDEEPHPVNYVGLDKRHHPNRLKLED